MEPFENCFDFPYLKGVVEGYISSLAPTPRLFYLYTLAHQNRQPCMETVVLYSFPWQAVFTYAVGD